MARTKGQSREMAITRSNGKYTLNWSVQHGWGEKDGSDGDVGALGACFRALFLLILDFWLGAAVGGMF